MPLPRKNSTYSEVIIVLLVALGNPIIASISMVFGGESLSSITELTQDRIIYMIFYEIMVLGLVTFFLKGRGWELNDLNLEFSWRLTIAGLILAICSVFFTNIAYYALTTFGTKPPESVLHYNPGDWSILPVLGLSIVNPVFEETIVVGYLMRVFMKPENSSKAINISVGVRLLYHLYQGIGGVITIVPMGLLFSYYYYKRRKLWPLIFAHGIMDFVGLVSL